MMTSAKINMSMMLPRFFLPLLIGVAEFRRLDLEVETSMLR
jgi:hypothetical protein